MPLISRENSLPDMHRILGEYIQRVSDDELPLILPQRRGLKRIQKGLIFHEYSEFFIQIHGSSEFRFPYERIILEPGQALIVPPELPHGERAIPDEKGFTNLVITPAADYFQCHLSREQLMPQLGGLVPVIARYERISGTHPPEPLAYASALMESAAHNDRYSAHIRKGLMLALLSTAARTLDKQDEDDARQSLADRIRNLVLSRYQYPDLSVASLAAQVNRSADYLSWYFHEKTGTPLKRYISQIRLDRATDMLRNTDYNISEIAWNCGYASPAYFSRAFSRRFGMSPGHYRSRGL